MPELDFQHDMGSAPAPDKNGPTSHVSLPQPQLDTNTDNTVTGDLAESRAAQSELRVTSCNHIKESGFTEGLPRLDEMYLVDLRKAILGIWPEVSKGAKAKEQNYLTASNKDNPGKDMTGDSDFGALSQKYGPLPVGTPFTIATKDIWVSMYRVIY